MSNNLAYTWKANLISNENKKLAGLLKDNFDEASFLYDLYKTSTVNEVSSFKFHLNQAQTSIIEVSMKKIIEENKEQERSYAQIS